MAALWALTKLRNNFSPDLNINIISGNSTDQIRQTYRLAEVHEFQPSHSLSGCDESPINAVFNTSVYDESKLCGSVHIHSASGRYMDITMISTRQAASFS